VDGGGTCNGVEDRKFIMVTIIAGHMIAEALNS
jgi:hypothetical protein